MANLTVAFHNFANASKIEFMKELRNLIGLIYNFPKNINEYNRPLTKTTITMDTFCCY